MATIIDNVKLDENNVEFNYASDFVKHTDKLVYLTGKAGTGKTTFLKYLRATTTKNTVILAPTGVAAINAGGQTIHSFFQIPLGPFVPNDKRLRIKADSNDEDQSTIYHHFRYSHDKLSIIEGLELLVIDEISMVRCDLLDVIDRLLKVFRHRECTPFGGVQVVLIGDTFQLPPVADFEQWSILQPFYPSPFFFSSKVIQNNKPVYIELKKIYRQNEQEFIDLLNRVRINQVNDEELNLLNSKFNPMFTPNVNANFITLATHKRIVDATNLTKLSELTTELKSFEATLTGTFPDALMPTDRVLQLKEGAQIMFVKNDIAQRYFNGKIAKINKIEDNRIIVALSDESKIAIEKQVWENRQYTWNEKYKKIEEVVIGTFTQFPIKLAWAITVHKSQGLTFEKVIADLGAAFTSGQVYVALSRCTTFNGLVLKTKIDRTAIKIDPKVLEFAQNETPNTLIVQELNSGKADYYYRKSREGIKQNNYKQALENFLQAIKFRNDIETEIFKKYITLTGNRLSSYKTLYQKTKSESERLNIVLSDITTTNFDLLSKIESQDHKIEEQNEYIKLLSNKADELTVELKKEQEEKERLLLQLEEIESQYVEEKKCNRKLNEENHIIIKQQQEIQLNLLTAVEKENQQSTEIIQLEKIIAQQSNEIQRLKNLRFYQRIFGIK